MEFSKEKDFEKAVISLLVDRGWEPETIDYPTEEELLQNWADILFQNNREQDSLNDCPLTEGEMQQLMEQIYTLRTPWRLNDFINGKSVSVRRDNPNDALHYGKEISLHIYDQNEIALGRSRYQIARQPKFKTKSYVLPDRRGDLMLLINGMPVIHMELKKSGIHVSQAYNQIEKYAEEGVFTGLFSLVQVFVAMQPKESVYFANPGPGEDGKYKFNKAYYFHWADIDNNPLNDWKDVVTHLLNIPMAHTLIGFYTIADEKDNTLKVMRSYQYYAATKIADKVTKKDWRDLNPLGGYIWHTTGSGKTLTSFKSAQLINSSGDADKVIFLVDRKALGKQSLDDYTDFAGHRVVVQGTEDGDALMAVLKSNETKDSLIVTSIQKLSNITKDNERIKTADLEKIVAKKIVIIIDEAHRSTFGEMLTNIKDTFKYAIIFGFTGTPIHDVNSKKNNTTTSIFGDELHRYTLADGIRDKNVLGFDPYMVMTYRDSDLRLAVALHKAKAATVEEALADKRKAKVYNRYMNRSLVPMLGFRRGNRYVKGIEELVPNSQYTRDEHKKAVLTDIKNQWKVLSHNGKFHSIFATHSIPEAVAYYRMAKTMLPELAITAVFDPNIDNDGGGTLEKEDGIVEILEDYKERYDAEFTIPSYDKFREDVQLRLAHKKPYNGIKREQQIDILIVVNQMLTGYDSKWINTLYMDKLMEYENLIQAFSRTNRLFGEDKPFGVIRYYRRPHLMARNIEEAVKAYSGDVPVGLFVDKLPKNLENMNRVFGEIRELFRNANIDDFASLPEEKTECAKFAKLFQEFNTFLEAASIQGFHWGQPTYLFEESEGEKEIKILFTEEEFLTLAQRYKELCSGGGGGRADDVPFDIDTHLTEINTDAIDSDYMNSRFSKYLKLVMDEADAKLREKTLKELHKSFARLPVEEQKYANLFLRDFHNGNIVITDGKSFLEYISEYKESAENERITRIVRRIGVNETKLRNLLKKKVTEANIDDFGRFDDLVKTVDWIKARRFFSIVDRAEIGEPELKIRVDEYLRDFLLTEGHDAFEDVSDFVPSHVSEIGDYESGGNGGDGNSGSHDDDEPKEKRTLVKVSHKQLNEWCKKSPALATLMQSGNFVFAEGKVCPFDDKYIVRDESGNIRLSDYAKGKDTQSVNSVLGKINYFFNHLSDLAMPAMADEDDSEDDVVEDRTDKYFLQFVTDENGKLHYVKLPPAKADMTFRYSDKITNIDDILKRFGLVSEIKARMLEEIYGLEFGPSLRELMSRRICNCSAGLLRSITGIDNNTTELMWRGKSLKIKNVISACLGIHIPYPVSSELLSRASMSVNPSSPPESNSIYHQLLTVSWATDYDDILEDLKADGHSDLLKSPGTGKRKKKSAI